MQDDMQEKVYKVLFVCTGNSARSIMAEALLTTMGKGRFKGYSAGSHPNGTVNPHAIEQVAITGYPVSELRSKSWDEFGVAGAPQMDFIVTVCDNAAGATCPVWPGHPMSAHWGFEDPAAVTGTDEEKARHFNDALLTLKRRIDLMLALPLARLDAMSLQHELSEIGTTGRIEA